LQRLGKKGRERGGRVRFTTKYLSVKTELCRKTFKKEGNFRGRGASKAKKKTKGHNALLTQ